MKLAIARWTIARVLAGLPRDDRLDRELRSGLDEREDREREALRHQELRRLGAPRDEERRADHRREGPERGERGALLRPLRGPRRGTASSRTIFHRAGYSMAAVTAIESPSNPFVREIARSLEARTHFLLEGEKSDSRGRRPPGSISSTCSTTRACGPGGWPRSRRRGRGSSRARVLERLAESKTPQHLLAIARRRDVPVAEILARRGSGPLSLRSPGSRQPRAPSCASARRPARAGVVGAPGSADFFHPRAVRASAGSVLRDSRVGPRLLRAVRGRRAARGPDDLRRGGGGRREPVRGSARPRVDPRRRIGRNAAFPPARTGTSTGSSRFR